MAQKMTRAEHLKAALEVPWQVKHPRVALYSHRFPLPQWETCPIHPSQKIAVSRRGSLPSFALLPIPATSHTRWGGCVPRAVISVEIPRGCG